MFQSTSRLFGFHRKRWKFFLLQNKLPPISRHIHQVSGTGGGWSGLLLFGLFGSGLLSLYFYFKKQKKEKEEMVSGVGVPKIGAPFALVDHNGLPRTSASFLGEWTMLYFGFTFCPDICPTELTKITKVITTMEQDYNVKIVPVFISVDPWRDSVEQVRTYLKEFHPRFVGLTGTPEQIQKVAKAYRVYYSKPPDDNTTDYLVDHSIFTYLLDRNGNFVDYFGVNRDENQIVESLKRHIQHREKLHIPLTHRLKRFLRFIKKTNATENK